MKRKRRSLVSLECFSVTKAEVEVQRYLCRCSLIQQQGFGRAVGSGGGFIISGSRCGGGGSLTPKESSLGSK